MHHFERGELCGASFTALPLTVVRQLQLHADCMACHTIYANLCLQTRLPMYAHHTYASACVCTMLDQCLCLVFADWPQASHERLHDLLLRTQCARTEEEFDKFDSRMRVHLNGTALHRQLSLIQAARMTEPDTINEVSAPALCMHS